MLLFLAVLLSHLAGAEEIAVGSEDKIQGAIDKAMSGDVIKVQSGTYYENLNVNKLLTLLGVDAGGGKPVIDARRMGPAVTLSEDGIRLEGFMVTNSSNSSKPMESKGFYKILPEGIDPQLAFAGILVDGSENCTVENNTATLNDVGILLWKANGNRIIKNIARENTYAGIALSEHCRNNNISGNSAVKSIPGDGIRVSGSNNTFVDNNARENAYYGIMLWESPSNILKSNVAHNNGHSGLWLMNSSGNIVTENNFSHNNESGISIWYSSNNSSISENFLSGNSRYGIYLKRSYNNSILRNNVVANERWGIGLDRSSENNVAANIVRDHLLGITLFERSNDNLVSNNSVSKSENYGIQLNDSSRNIIAENHVCRNGAGIGLYSSSDDNFIEGNNASYNIGNGIDLDDCCNNTVRKNRADYNEWGGIGLYLGSEENAVEDNEVGYNNWAGIILTGCDGNVVAGNNASRNLLGGIKLQKSKDNLLFQNNLIENAMDGAAVRSTSPLLDALLKLSQDERAENAYDDAINQWDNGTSGNYYSDFVCSDSDGNGICDSEHAIPGCESVDRYPLSGMDNL